MAASEQEQDLVLKVTLNNIHRFVVVIAKKSPIADLKSEITKVSSLLLSSADLGEITSVQSCGNHELPEIYKVGRLLKEGDSILAYSTSHISNHANSMFIEQDAGTLEVSQILQGQKPIQNKSDSTDISKDVVRENSTKGTEDLAASCDNEQECSSKRNEKEDMDKRNNNCKDSGFSERKKTKLKTKDLELASSGNYAEQECSKQRKENKTANSTDDSHKSSGCTKEKSRNRTQDLEGSSSNKDEESTDKIDEHESMEKCKETEDRNSEGRSLERLTTKRKEQNHETPLINNEEEQQSIMQCQEKKDKDNKSKQSSIKKGKNKEILPVDENCNDKDENMSLNTAEQEDTLSDVFFTQWKGKHKKKPQEIQNIRNSDDNTQENKRQSKEKVQNCEDLSSKEENQNKIQEDGEVDDSENFSRNGETKNRTHEIQTTRNESFKNRNEATQNERQDNVDSNGENPRNRIQSLFQMDNFILLSEQENCEPRDEDDQNEKSRPTGMRTRKRGFNTQMKLVPTSDSERIEKTSCSKCPATEQAEKISRRKWKRSRTQSIDESLADEDQRNKPNESPSTGSQPSSIVSETVLKSQAFKEMLESTGCFSQRRRQAIEKSVTKVATWLVDHNEGIEDETPTTVQRKSTELLDNTLQEPCTNHCMIDSLNNNSSKDGNSFEVYHEDISRIYPIIDVLQDRVLYFDSDPSDASGSGGLIKETCLRSCTVVIPKLNLTQSVPKGLKTCNASEPQSIPLDVTPVETNVVKRTEEGSGTAVVCVTGCQDMDEEDCGCGSHGIIGSSGSVELFPASLKLKHLMSYTNEPLPGNVNKSLEHDGNEKEDRESCFSTEILDSEEKANGNQNSLPKKRRLPLDLEGATTNETGENELQHGQEVEKRQESSDKILEDDTNSQLEDERMICDERVDHSHAEKNGTEQRDIEEAETTEDLSNDRSKTEQACLSSPKKKKNKKKKSRETGESIVPNSGEGSVLSENVSTVTNDRSKTEQVCLSSPKKKKKKKSRETGESIVANSREGSVLSENVSTVTNDRSKTEQVCLSSPKKKKKKKSRETGESIVANGGEGSVLSENGMNCTSSIKNDSRKDKMSKQRRKQDKICSDDNRAEEDTKQSMSKGRKKKDKRTRMQEKIAAATSEKTKVSEKDNDNAAEKESEDSPNKETLSRESSAKSRNKDISIQESSAELPNIQTVIPERSASSPCKGTSVKVRLSKTELSFPKPSVSLPNDVNSTPEKLTKGKSKKDYEKSKSKNKDIPEKNLPGGSQDVIDTGDDLQKCSQSTVTTSKERNQESVTEENSFEDKARKKKKKKKKKKKTDISTEEISEGKGKQKKNEKLKSKEDCSVDKEAKMSSFGSRESTVLCVNEEENSDGKKRNKDKKDKKKLRDKVVEDEKVDICKEDATNKSSKTSKRDKKEESEAVNKPVKQVYKPALSSSKAKNDSDETGKEGKRTRDKTKKEMKRKEKVENNDMNKEKDDRDSELQEEIPKKKRKKSQNVCEENGKPSLKGSIVPPSHPNMFSSGSENESNIGVTDVLSWISKKINNQTTNKSSTKKTNKSALLDLAQEDQELNAHKTPFHSSTSLFTPESSSSQSRIFHKTPIGFTNTVPRISKKLNLTTSTFASSRRKRKLSTSPPQSRELTREEKEMLSGGVKRLEELLDDDSFWD